jgi:glycosyltransferase involved in cell wall biosynthesis/GT2 family glycosyltransferase
VNAGISVVIPSYNHARWLPEAVGSVRVQSLPVDELVVVDDGSTDDSVAVLEALRFDRMRLEVQGNRGAHAALNRAVEASRGDWIAILNSDDVMEPDRIEAAWGIAAASGAALVCGEVMLVGEDGAPAPEDHDIARWYAEARALARDAPSLKDALRTHNVAVTTSNFFLHRSLWEALGGFRPWRWVHDYDFILRATSLCPGRVVYEPSMRGVRYRVHGANTISESHERALEERSAMLGDVRSLRFRARTAMASGRRREVVRAVARSGDLAPMRGDAAPVRASKVHDADAPTRAGLVVPGLGTGGLEEVVALLAEALPAAGVDTEVYCTHAGGTVADRLRRSGVPVTIGDGTPERCVSWVVDSGVEVVSSHFVDVPIVARLASEGLPVIETIHNTYAWLGDEGWARERERVKHARTLVAVSDVAAAYFERRAGRAPDHVVGNAVHPGRIARVPRPFARRCLDVEASTPLAVAVGRVTRQKNPDGLLHAFAGALDEVPDARLLLVGPDDASAPIAELRSRHRALFSHDRVRWLGARSDVGVVLSAADAFVSGAWYEGWSVAASEAAWIGVPLVLTDAGAAAALVGAAGERGVLVPNPAGDPLAVDDETIASPPPAALEASVAALARGLADVLCRKESWREGAATRRAWARSGLAPAGMAARYAAVLRAAARR